jgi:hypothetical protein
MIAAIIDKTSPTGIVPVTQFQEAADTAAALAAFVAAFNPPKNPADWLAYDTGWPNDTYQPTSSPKYKWGYDFDTPGLVEVAYVESDAKELPIQLALNSGTGFYPAIYQPQDTYTRWSVFKVPHDFGTLIALEFDLTPSAVFSGVNLLFIAGWNRVGEVLGATSNSINMSLDAPVAGEMFTIDGSDVFSTGGPLEPGMTVGVQTYLEVSAPGDLHVFSGILRYLPKDG